jgi:hypothetical protein
MASGGEKTEAVSSPGHISRRVFTRQIATDDRIGMTVPDSPGTLPASSGPARSEENMFNMSVLCGDHPPGLLFLFTRRGGWKWLEVPFVGPQINGEIPTATHFLHICEVIKLRQQVAYKVQLFERLMQAFESGGDRN